MAFGIPKDPRRRRILLFGAGGVVLLVLFLRSRGGAGASSSSTTDPAADPASAWDQGYNAGAISGGATGGDTGTGALQDLMDQLTSAIGQWGAPSDGDTGGAVTDPNMSTSAGIGPDDIAAAVAKGISDAISAGRGAPQDPPAPAAPSVPAAPTPAAPWELVVGQSLPAAQASRLAVPQTSTARAQLAGAFGSMGVAGRSPSPGKPAPASPSQKSAAPIQTIAGPGHSTVVIGQSLAAAQASKLAAPTTKTAQSLLAGAFGSMGVGGRAPAPPAPAPASSAHPYSATYTTTVIPSPMANPVTQKAKTASLIARGL